MRPKLVRGLRTPGMVGELITADSQLHAEGEQTLRLAPGTRLAIEVEPQRWCLGFRDLEGVPVPCRAGARLDSGQMCAACRDRDPWKWMHIVHRSQFLDPAMRTVMMRPHWLYVATFAGGMQKVGTAQDGRKRARLDEQGPVAAHWVGWAEDGLAIRELEDLVSAELSPAIGLGQVVRSSAKTAGLSRSVEFPELYERHDDAVRQARDVLDGLPLQPASTVRSLAEPWPNPRDPESLTGLTLRPYPGSLGSGRHGFTVEQLWGPVGLVRLDEDPISHYAVDLSRLVGREITFGDFTTGAPEQQDSLF